MNHLKAIKYEHPYLFNRGCKIIIKTTRIKKENSSNTNQDTMNNNMNDKTQINMSQQNRSTQVNNFYLKNNYLQNKSNINTNDEDLTEYNFIKPRIYLTKQQKLLKTKKTNNKLFKNAFIANNLMFNHKQLHRFTDAKNSKIYYKRNKQIKKNVSLNNNSKYPSIKTKFIQENQKINPDKQAKYVNRAIQKNEENAVEEKYSRSNSESSQKKNYVGQNYFNITKRAGIYHYNMKFSYSQMDDQILNDFKSKGNNSLQYNKKMTPYQRMVQHIKNNKRNIQLKCQPSYYDQNFISKSIKIQGYQLNRGQQEQFQQYINSSNTNLSQVKHKQEQYTFNHLKKARTSRKANRKRIISNIIKINVMKNNLNAALKVIKQKQYSSKFSQHRKNVYNAKMLYKYKNIQNKSQQRCQSVQKIPITTTQQILQIDKNLKFSTYRKKYQSQKREIVQSVQSRSTILNRHPQKKKQDQIGIVNKESQKTRNKALKKLNIKKKFKQNMYKGKPVKQIIKYLKLYKNNFLRKK